MAGLLQITRARSRDFDRQVLDVNGTAYTALTTPFLSSDSLACKVWPGEEEPTSATPSTAWIDADTATFRITFAIADTSELAPGFYRYEVSVTRSAKTATIDRGRLEVVDAIGAADVAVPAYTGSTAGPGQLATLYCTDEDLLIRASQDFLGICPKSQVLAQGSDGEFAANDPWTLTSTLIDFEAAGVEAGNVVVLSGPRSHFPASGGSLLVVAAVDGNSVTLRRPGMLGGVGQPAVPAAGLAAVTFAVPYYRPQIDVASYDANKFFGIDVNNITRTPANLYDARELQQFTVLTVLRRLYIAAEKTAAGDYKLKLADVSAELEDLRARLVIRWGTSAELAPGTSIFSTRARR